MRRWKANMGSGAIKRPVILVGVLMVLVAIVATACAGGVSQKDYDTAKAQLTAKEQEVTAKEQQVAQLQTQVKGMAPVTIVQAGQLQPAPAGAQPSGWDTAESIRAGIQLLAQYDSSGADAWDVKAHPLVYIASEGPGYAHRPSKTTALPGFQMIDAYTKKVIAAPSYDLGNKVIFTPHGSGASPDGKWVYIGFRDETPTKETRNLTLIINARTLKLDKVLLNPARPNEGSSQRWLHHVQAFWDWQRRERVILMYGFGADGGTHLILDPKDNNRVVRAISIADLGYKVGHPYTTPSPDGKFIYVSLVAPAWREHTFDTGGIAKLNLETGAVTVIAGTGEHPIGITHTADGKFTYVNDGHGSRVYKIDNATNKVVGNTSAGVAGPYGLHLNWDETELWTVGKGEGSHNTGGVLGVITTKTFIPARGFDQPIGIGGSIMDHAILNPDPEVNELWVGSAGTWETIVVDLKTRTVKARIPSPNGGDTHNGAFVRYNPDWTGELQSDQGGPKSKTMLDMVKAKVAAEAAAK